MARGDSTTAEVHGTLLLEGCFLEQRGRCGTLQQLSWLGTRCRRWAPASRYRCRLSSAVCKSSTKTLGMGGGGLGGGGAGQWQDHILWHPCSPVWSPTHLVVGAPKNSC